MSGILEKISALQRRRIRQMMDVALSRIQRGCDRHITELCKAAAHVLYPFVHAKYLVDNEYDREFFALVGHCTICRDLAVGDRDIDLTDDEALVIRVNVGLRRDR